MNFYKNKKDIISWLNHHKIEGYTLIPDPKYGFMVDVKGDVDLAYNNLTIIPVKFNQVGGHFNCAYNQLKNLEFCPSSVCDDFYCYSNKLTNLEFCPTYVDGYFYCSDNKELKEIQTLTEFKQIYQIHQKLMIIKLHEQFNHQLSFKSDNAVKVKI